MQSGRRYRQIRGILKAEGAIGVVRRARKVTADWVASEESVFPVRRVDVLSADLSRPFLPVQPAIVPGEPLAANWVMTPPARGSGGHTTIFRIIRYLEAHGYRNRIYFYDVYRSDLTYYQSIVRDYYQFEGPVGDIADGMQDAHIAVATAWMTAYPLFNWRGAGKRYYFIQDFEPYFYPVGALSSLSEST